MAFRKIKPHTITKCPSCGGQSGVQFQQRGHMSNYLQWGNRIEFANQKNFRPNRKKIKTAICSDCNKRFEISD